MTSAAVNNSARINPFHYGGERMVEVILLHCVGCGRKERKRLPHSLSDQQIMEHFKGWSAKGFDGAEHTLCPNCQVKE